MTDTKRLIERLRDGIHPSGCASESPNPGLPCNCIRGKAADALERLSQQPDERDEEIARLREALEPFVRSLEWVDESEMPVRISNDDTASAWDLTWPEVVAARTALENKTAERDEK